MELHLAVFLFWLSLATGHVITKGKGMPEGPLVSGAIQKFDLLSNSENGINYPGLHIGAFVPQAKPPGYVNNELQEYVVDAAVQDANTNEVTITASKDANGKITSARLETYGVWSTKTSEDTKRRGYVEVRSTMPVKTNGKRNFDGAWPAIWMLGHRNGVGWPQEGEIDIVEAVNGDPTIYMSLHSSQFHGGNPQHPPENPYRPNSDFSQNPIIAGLEWNVQDTQIDITWWMAWFDMGSNDWQQHHTTKVLQRYGNNDEGDFYESFINGDGFSLLINLAEGGDWPSNNVFPDGQPQTMTISSAKVYGF